MIKVTFWLLVGVAVIFLPLLLWGGMIQGPRMELLAERALLISVAANVALISWMFVACVRDHGLSEHSRRRWELALIVGGSLTAFIYLFRHLYPGPTSRGTASPAAGG